MPTTNSVEDVYKKQYGSYRELLHREEMPPGFVGMDAVERSAEKVANKPEGKTIRVVSKCEPAAELTVEAIRKPTKYAPWVRETPSVLWWLPTTRWCPLRRMALPHPSRRKTRPKSTRRNDPSEFSEDTASTVLLRRTSAISMATVSGEVTTGTHVTGEFGTISTQVSETELVRSDGEAKTLCEVFGTGVD